MNSPFDLDPAVYLDRIAFKEKVTRSRHVPGYSRSVYAVTRAMRLRGSALSFAEGRISAGRFFTL
jgi:hypothetical protein